MWNSLHQTLIKIQVLNLSGPQIGIIIISLPTCLHSDEETETVDHFSVMNTFVDERRRYILAIFYIIM